MNFERGKDPAEALRIGKFKEIKKGDYFQVRFRYRRSCPEYYPLQGKEKQGIPADARAIEDEDENMWGTKNVKCIINTIPHEKFIAYWSRKENCWIVGDGDYNKTDDTGPR